MNEANDHPQELQKKLDEILKHGDPGVKDMLGDLIREFHNQLMEDPKSRASMKDHGPRLSSSGTRDSWPLRLTRMASFQIDLTPFARHMATPAIALKNRSRGSIL